MASCELHIIRSSSPIFMTDTLFFFVTLWVADRHLTGHSASHNCSQLQYIRTALSHSPASPTGPYTSIVFAHIDKEAGEQMQHKQTHTNTHVSTHSHTSCGVGALDTQRWKKWRERVQSEPVWFPSSHVKSLCSGWNCCWLLLLLWLLPAVQASLWKT